MTYDQFYYLRKICRMFDPTMVPTVTATVKETYHGGIDVLVNYVINNFRLILLAHATLPEDLKRKEFMVELQRVLEIP